MSRRFLMMASMALNVTLAGVGIGLVKRPVPGGPASPALNIITNRPVRVRTAAEATPAPPAVSSVPAAFDWSQVASTNLAQYATNLRAIGCPNEIIREVILAVVNEDFVRRRHAIFEPIHAQFWELMAQPEHFTQDYKENTDYRGKQLRTERDHQLEAVLGANWQRDTGRSPLPVYYHQPTLNFLPEEKQRRWSELDENFNQLQQEIYRKTRGNAADQKVQLEAIAKEREAARRQLLTADEFQEYTARTSSQAVWAQNLAGFEATEEEYRTLNQLRASTPPNQMSQFNTQAQALLGEERFAVFQRGQDQRFAEIQSLAERCQLPKNTVQLLYQQRSNAEQQCAQVRSNVTLAAEEKRTLLLVIQSETRQQLFSVLGETAGEAYLRHQGNWIKAMDKGNQP
jgi:hypothetical protein